MPATKISTVLSLLQREGGAKLEDIVDATGWLPHTTRAALTGLRKKGHAITRTKSDAGSCYRIIKAA
jgi:DNA-binding IclR family transcriptional regulator